MVLITVSVGVRTGGSMSESVPAGEVFVSSFDQLENDFTIRFVNDFHPEVIEGDEVFCLKLGGLREAGMLANYLADCIRNGECVYLSQVDHSIELVSESGESLVVTFTTINCQKAAFNELELRKSINRIYACYEHERAALREARIKLNKVNKFIDDQRRRVEAKAGSHEATSTAGLLYRQQLDTLSRLSRLLASEV